jgi:hypothetical protein
MTHKRGVKGWLLIYFLYVLANIIGIFVAFFVRDLGDLLNKETFQTWFNWVAVSSQLIIATLFLIALVFLVMQKRKAEFWNKLALVVAIVIVLLRVSYELIVTVPDLYLLVQVVWGVFYILWLWYWVKSKRVENTFG